MTMNVLFNSLFENSLRILLLLDVYDLPQTLDTLYTVDFITFYGKTFGMSKSNLNGDNEYKFSEFVSRRENVKEALRELVLNGTVQAVGYKGGISYVITTEGEDFCQSLNSEYAVEYRKNAEAAVRASAGNSERAIISKINKLSANALRKALLMSRFYITQVAAFGPKVEFSAIELKDGVNFIVGPSNTGKSYMINCIDFMLGRKEPSFSKVDTGYDKIHINLESDDGYWLSATRMIEDGKNGNKGSNIVNVDTSIPDIKETEFKISSKEYSDLLLRLMGIEKRPRIIAT